MHIMTQDTRTHGGARASRTRRCLLLLSVMASLALSSVSCQEYQWGQQHRRQRPALAARRAADDSRPLTRVPPNGGQHHQHHPRALIMAAAQSRVDSQVAPAPSGAAAAEPSVITGRFKAPAPEQVHQQRVPKSAQFGAHVMSGSYRVANSEAPEKLVHGQAGASLAPTQSVQRTVSAKFQVSDEGLNYPPSKLSADIYGNVAEIVTAPPEAVESDFLLPSSRRFGAPARP